MGKSDTDVIIIGAGISGLACAKTLMQEDISFLILEAGQKVGGRIKSDHVDGFILDHGFQVLQTAYPESRSQLLTAPSYSSSGRHLIAVVVLDHKSMDNESLVLSVRRELRQWFGDPVRNWNHIKTYHIGHAVPDQSPPVSNPAINSGKVLFSSVAAQRGFSMHTSSRMAKGAVNGLTRSLAAELSPKIRANAISPSVTQTPLAEKILSNKLMAESIKKSIL